MTNSVKQAAKEAGLKRYFDGVPCRKAGHVSERFTSNGACVACVYAANGKEAPAYAPPAGVAIAPPPLPKIDKEALLQLIPEHQFRLFDQELPAFEAVTVPLCLAAAPGLTVLDVRPRKAPTSRKGPTALYSVRVPPAMLELARGVVKGLFAKHAMTDEQVARIRAEQTRGAAQLALEERPPIPDWSFK